ncbi:MAG TPA: Gldg family protein [Vicinamibacteria bacterium]|nr:Gldg family protein [Vicinamibacteria bacterium]HRB11382.1 Gldg family protein [Vicinamibacteria bacterium]
MKLTDLFSALGLVLLFVRFFEKALQALPPSVKPEWLVPAGLTLALIGVAARMPDLTRALGARRLKYGSNTAVFVLLVAAILGGVNWMANRYPKRLDVSKDQRFSLSEQTRKILAGLQGDVTLTYVQRNAATSATAKDVLREYEAASPRVKVEYVDPMKEPGKARALDVAQLPTIVVAMGERREKILSDGEEDITNAILKLTRNVKKTVCFASGEGERDIDDPSEHGYSGVKSAISKSQYEIKKVVLLQEQKVPEDCTVLVVTGPAKDLLPEAAGYVKAFVRGGGKAMLMADPVEKAPSPNYESIFTEFGVKPGADVVVDASGVGQLFGTGPFMPIVTDYPFHEINKDLKGTMSAYDMARSMTPVTPLPDGVTVQELAKTSTRSWGESDTSLKDPVEFSDEKDSRGPLNLAVAITVRPKAPAPESPDAAAAPTPDASKKEGRVVAVGDSNFGSNGLLTFQANQDLFMNMVAWLAQDSDLISIRPKDPDVHRLDLTMGEQRNVLIFSLLLLPGFFIIWGITNWWRRRS